jgi:Fe-S oxidoreductase
MSGSSAECVAEDALVRAVEKRSGQNVYACYQCGKCTAGCPFSLAPQQVMRFLQLGQPEAALTHATTWDCASCMTCQTACPKGVSPARVQRALRTLDWTNGAGSHATPTFVQQKHAHAHPLRTALFANIHTLSKLGSAMAPMSNWAFNVPGAKLVADCVLGIHKDRSLPAFARETFPAWFRRHTPIGNGQRGTVLLFHDTFMDYNYPRTGIAVTELLETAGFRVELADMVCCGRPMISKGLLAKAAGNARINVTRLYEHARQGIYVVGCEPSCLLTLREEYLDLVPKEMKEKARVVAEHAVLVDEFLDILDDRKELDLAFRAPEGERREVLFHGHCHQKAAADPAKSLALLRMAGYEAEMADAPCCGMAGAYGFEKEHYEASRAAGERALFPIIRQHPGAEIAVMGTSCRQQVEHFTGRRARHVVEFLREALTT